MVAIAYLWGAPWADAVTAIFTIVIASGVALAWLQLRAARRARDAQIIQQLMEQWDSPRMIEARRLIASSTGPSAVQRMADDFKNARTTQTGNYFLFTYNLNFWEQLGLSYGDDRPTLHLINAMFGDLIWSA
jgi:hypothetical protein